MTTLKKIILLCLVTTSLAGCGNLGRQAPGETKNCENLEGKSDTERLECHINGQISDPDTLD